MKDLQWQMRGKKTILETIPFAVEELDLYDVRADKAPHPYYRLKCADWVNVLPITADGKALLVRQTRAGSFTNVLEVPAGLMDAGEVDPALTVARELEEETGYTSRNILPLGSMNPNPAIMTNRLHMYVALDCTPAVNRQYFPDENESIEVVVAETRDLTNMVREGQIDSCLCALTVMLAGRYVEMGD